MHFRRLSCALILVLAASAAFGQSTGSISGKVTATDGSALPGVTVEAASNVLPQARVTTTDANGSYRFPSLIPGTYTVTFTLGGMQTVTRKAEVTLGHDTPANTKMGVQGVTESITVTARSSLVDKETTQLTSGLSSNEIARLPVAQNYRDLQKLIPGVMYTQDSVRGPSAGASGQDNVYMFDGVNITMPLFGVLNTEPTTNDIAQVNVIRGGANAEGFNRAGGFLIDTVSKSGTNKFTGMLSYQTRRHNFVAKREHVGVAATNYLQDRDWAEANIGGPIIHDQLFFYGSFYRPNYTQSSQSNLYGPLPTYNDKRTVEFGKLTYTPTQSWLFNGSYRHSHELQNASAFGSTSAPQSGTGYETWQKIAAVEGSDIINSRSFATFKLMDYRNPGNGRSDVFSSAAVNTALGTQLDLANLGTLGRVSIPTPTPATAAFLAPFIQKYGWICPTPAVLGCTPGQPSGPATVGYGLYQHDDDDFYRKGGQVGYNLTLGSQVTHELHAGFQRYYDSEDRFQVSNGWGSISIPAGVGTAGTCPATVCGVATPAFFVATVNQGSSGSVPVIHSEVHSTNIEFNDRIKLNNWTFNVGVLDSQDILYGQGLAKADNYAGYVKSPGTKYLMHTFNFKDMIQPRLGATWAYNGVDTVYASFARYMPPANSDARAASWDRNLIQTISAYFDATGKLIGVQPNGSSVGKWWTPGIKHPEIKEVMLGTARQMSSHWSARLYGRARKGDHYLEDTNNNARSRFNPPAGVPRTDYVPDLCNGSLSTCGPNTIRGAIGSGSTYVIANLDGAFTKYLEATAETDYATGAWSLHGSYTWSHYYGNFDQDNSTFNSNNDQATFIGSSNIGDGAGRQIWDMRYGDLRGDRRNVLKGYAIYQLPWNASAGAWYLYQSGQPYQLESVLPYRPLTGSTSDTNRYAEEAGSRRSPSYSTVDLNYTQSLALIRSTTLQLSVNIYNAINHQTGYDYETRVQAGLGFVDLTKNPSTATVPIPASIADSTLAPILGSATRPFNRSEWGVLAPFPKNFYAPRRFEVALKLLF